MHHHRLALPSSERSSSRSSRRLPSELRPELPSIFELLKTVKVPKVLRASGGSDASDQRVVCIWHTSTFSAILTARPGVEAHHAVAVQLREQFDIGDCRHLLSSLWCLVQVHLGRTSDVHDGAR